MKNILVFVTIFGLLEPFARAAQVTTEPYSFRPNILSVSPKAHDLLPTWNRTKRGILESVAFLFEAYADYEIYFLARDGEVLGDGAFLAASNDSELLNRLHLINVSTLNLATPGLRKYLKQEGFDRAVGLHKKILIVDTGFRGTIAKKIKSLYPKQSQIEFQLLVSHDPNIPSLRVFASAVNPTTVMGNPYDWQNILVPIEVRPKYTMTSERFQFHKATKRWEPISQVPDNFDLYQKSGYAASPRAAMLYMEDIAFFFHDESNVQLLDERRKFIRDLLNLARQNKRKFIQKAKAEWMLHPTDPYYESLIRDLIDAQKKNKILGTNLNLTCKDFGIDENIVGQTHYITAATLVDIYPQWKNLLLKPKKAISQLIRDKRFQEIEDLVSVADDGAYLAIVLDELGRTPWHPAMERIAQVIIDKNNESVSQAVAYNILAKPEAPKALIDFYLSRSHGIGLNALAIGVFSVPHSEDLSDLMEILIRKSHGSVLADIAQYSFPKTAFIEKARLADLFMQMADPRAINIFKEKGMVSLLDCRERLSKNFP